MPMLMPSASSASTGHLRALRGTQKIPGSRGAGVGDGQRHQWELKRHSASDTSFEADERTGIAAGRQGERITRSGERQALHWKGPESTALANCPACASIVVRN